MNRKYITVFMVACFSFQLGNASAGNLLLAIAVAQALQEKTSKLPVFQQSKRVDQKISYKPTCYPKLKKSKRDHRTSGSGRSHFQRKK